jgi:hypothetical protein
MPLLNSCTFSWMNNIPKNLSISPVRWKFSLQTYCPSLDRQAAFGEDYTVPQSVHNLATSVTYFICHFHYINTDCPAQKSVWNKPLLCASDAVVHTEALKQMCIVLRILVLPSSGYWLEEGNTRLPATPLKVLGFLWPALWMKQSWSLAAEEVGTGLWRKWPTGKALKLTLCCVVHVIGVILRIGENDFLSVIRTNSLKKGRNGWGPQRGWPLV